MGVRSYTHFMNSILLPPAERDTIKECANSLLKRYIGYYDGFERLAKVARDHGVEVLEADMYDISGTLKLHNGRWKIYINRSDSSTRQLFTLAHELGHYFLHREDADEFVDGEYVMNRMEETKYQKEELEANEFAGNLVMPERMIRDKVGEGQPTDDMVIDLAHLFHVSPLAMAIRLRSLGYEPSEF